MSKEKQIEEMADVLDNAKMDARATIGSMNHGFGIWYANALYTAGYRKQSEWISVAERLPEEKQKVLLYSPADGIQIGHRLDEVGRFYVSKSYPDRPTHWMPLPEPPQMKGGAE